MKNLRPLHLFYSTLIICALVVLSAILIDHDFRIVEKETLYLEAEVDTIKVKIIDMETGLDAARLKLDEISCLLQMDHGIAEEDCQ